MQITRLDQIRTIHKEKTQKAQRVVHRHTSFYCTLQILYLLQIKDWWNPVSSKSVGAIFPTALYLVLFFNTIFKAYTSVNSHYKILAIFSVLYNTYL